MKVILLIASLKKTIYSFEILPPLKNHHKYDIFNTIYYLVEFKPPFINVTAHRDDEKRLRTIAICVAIMHKYEINVIPHLICKGNTSFMKENVLIELYFLGIYNILILRGDIIKYYTKKNAHNFSIDLVKQIVYLKNSNIHSNFCIGIAAYPEKHFEAPNLEEDIFRLYEKIKAGSFYVMTQMFFDNNKYFDFIEKMRFAHLKIPIIPGIKPISSIDQLKSIPSNFYVNLPTKLVKKITKYKKDIWNIGIEWAIKQSIELKEAGIKIIHYFTMNKPDNIYQIMIELN